MKPLSLCLLCFALASCGKSIMPTAKITMKLSIRVDAHAEVATVTANGKKIGVTPLDLDVMALPFAPELKPAAWPPPGARVLSPTSAQHGKEESSLGFALMGDIVYVRTLVHGTETLGGMRLVITGADGKTLGFESGDKELASGLGRAEHSFKMFFKRGN